MSDGCARRRLRTPPQRLDRKAAPELPARSAGLTRQATLCRLPACPHRGCRRYRPALSGRAIERSPPAPPDQVEEAPGKNLRDAPRHDRPALQQFWWQLPRFPPRPLRKIRLQEHRYKGIQQRRLRSSLLPGAPGHARLRSLPALETSRYIATGCAAAWAFSPAPYEGASHQPSGEEAWPPPGHALPDRHGGMCHSPPEYPPNAPSLL